MIKVIHFHRKPRKDFHSIENIYREIRTELKDKILFKVVQMPFYCSSHLGKVLNMIYAAFFRADVLHITGGIHYIAALLPKRKTIISVHSVEGGRPRMKGLKKNFSGNHILPFLTIGAQNGSRYPTIPATN